MAVCLVGEKYNGKEKKLSRLYFANASADSPS